MVASAISRIDLLFVVIGCTVVSFAALAWFIRTNYKQIDKVCAMIDDYMEAFDADSRSTRHAMKNQTEALRMFFRAQGIEIADEDLPFPEAVGPTPPMELPTMAERHRAD